MSSFKSFILFDARRLREYVGPRSITVNVTKDAVAQNAFVCIHAGYGMPPMAIEAKIGSSVVFDNLESKTYNIIAYADDAARSIGVAAQVDATSNPTQAIEVNPTGGGAPAEGDLLPVTIL